MVVERTLEADPSDRVEPMPAFAPGATIAHFRIVRELGAGGMGVVFEADDADLGRRVAIKVVRDRNAGTAAGMRLIAEAQAMAKLAHPNVVGVHEVGTIENQVYVVMELVRGDTLAGWLDRHPRPWRDIVAVFLQAGEGLLAAHHAGLIHRDFKPSNVLIDDSGRARVGDFGLARGDDHRPVLAAGSSHSGVAGTLAYMAPEQRCGEPVDARADQYSFAISLQQALAPKHAIGAPTRRVKNAIAKALEIDPDERFASLDLLLAELRTAHRSRRAMIATAAGGVVMAGLAASLFFTRPEVDDCADGARLVDEVWGPSARLAQVARFLQVRPSSLIASASTAQLVDDWADRWKLGRKQACAAHGPARVERLGCLDRGLHELRAQVALWQQADTTVVDHAVKAAAALPQPQECATHASVVDIDSELGNKIAALSAQVRSGHAREAHASVPELLKLAEAQPSPGPLAAALVAAGRVEREVGNFVVAREHYSRAAKEAAKANDDKLMLDALIEEAVVIVHLGRPRDSLGLLDAAAALQTRAKIDEHVRIALVRGDALGQAGRAKEAIAEMMAVLPEVEARALRDPAARMTLTTALGQLAAAQIQIDREAARKTLTRALEIDEKTFGPDHPEVAKTLHDLGAAELRLERFDESRTHLERAMKILITSYGERHPMVGANYMTMAHLELMLGQLDKGRSMYVAARDSLTGKLPEDAPHFSAIEQALGDIERTRDNCKGAIPHFEKAIRLLERSGHGENERAMQLTNLGFCLQDVGRKDEGREKLELSIAEIERLDMPKRWLSEPLAVLADLEFAAGRKAKAIELVKKAIAALDGETGTDVAALRQYEEEQLAAWTKPPRK